MGKHFSLVASDSFKLGAYRADPSGAPKGGVVVIQEIFGVNHHIRAVCDSRQSHQQSTNRDKQNIRAGKPTGKPDKERVNATRPLSVGHRYQ